MLHRLPGNPTREQLEAAYAQGMLRKEALRDGAYYQGRCRNATIARWHAAAQKFVHWRTKFNARFLESIRHPEDEQNYDVFMAEHELSEEDVLAANSLISEDQFQRFFSPETP